MLSHCSLGAGQRLGIRDGRERPAEAWGEEPVLTWNWSFLPGWLLAMLSYYSRHPASRHDFSIAGQKTECFTITQSRITSMSGLVRAMELSFPRQT